MNILHLLGWLVYGGFFLMMAMNHFTQTDMLAGYAQAKGVPSPRLAVLGSGVWLLIGGVSVLTGFQPKIGILALVLFLLPVSLQMHAFWKETDEQAKMTEMGQFLKNMALLGAALALLALPEPWPFGLGG